MTPPTLHVLKNGLTVLLAPCEAESVAFGLFIGSGSRHEDEKTAGISHFIEHMLFKGTPTRRPIDITRSIEGRGGSFNACTGEESTSYYAHLPSEYLKEAIEILSDMYLNATIPEEEFAREKEVVIEEIRMYADEPDAVAMENLQSALFPKHSLGRPVAGSERSLRPIKAEDLRRYIKSHYLPRKTVAVIVGAFDRTVALKLLQDTFESVRNVSVSRRKPRVERFSSPSPLITAAKPDLSQTQLALGYRTFGIHDSRIYAGTVLDAILGRGMSSRLFQEVREKRGLSYDISSRMHYFGDTGMFVITAGVDPKKADATLKIIDRELEKLKVRRVSALELRRIKEYLIGNFRLSHERITSKLFFYGNTLLSFGHLVTVEEQIEGIRRVSAEDIQKLAQTIFAPSARSLSLVTPRT